MDMGELRLGGGERLCYELTRKQVKRVNVRVRADGSVAVSAPRGVPLAAIEAFLREKEDFLLTAIQKAHTRAQAEAAREESAPLYFGRPLSLCCEKGRAFRAEREGDVLRLTLPAPEDAAARRTALECWRKDCCAAEAERLLRQWLPTLAPHGVPEPTLRFRRMTSRWGSCAARTHTVTLNTRLLDYPAPCFELILLHELCHFLQPDHSPAFYRWLERFLPDWRERKRLLR